MSIIESAFEFVIFSLTLFVALAMIFFALTDDEEKEK